MSTALPTNDQTEANIRVARRCFNNMFEEHNPYQHCSYSYNSLGRAVISLDSRFSVGARFYEVWRGLISTPRDRWRFERTIFCIDSKNDMNYEYIEEDDHYVLPAEAMVNMSSDIKQKEAVISFHFDLKVIEFSENELCDNLKVCNFEKPSIKYIKSKVPEVSYLTSLRISESSGIPSGIKHALRRIDANFQRTYNCMIDVRSMHQSKLQIEASAILAQEPQADEPDKIAEPLNQTDTKNNTKPLPPAKSTESKARSPKKPSPKSTDSTNSDKECSYCARKTTPMWRRGPAGPGTLCNACGVKWRHGKILCDQNPTETAASPSTATAENVDPLNNTKSNNTRTKRKYSKSTETLQPAKKQQQKNTHIDFTQDEGPSGSPHSLDLNTLTADEDHHALGVDAVEAATVLALLKRR